MLMKTKKEPCGGNHRVPFELPQPVGAGCMVSPIVAELTGRSSTPSSPTSNRSASIGKHQVVLNGIDTLSITAGGVGVPSSWLIEQQVIWNQYHNEYEYGDDYMCIEMNNLWWELYPHGSNPYKFQLRNNEVGFVKVWNTEKWSSGVTGKQQVHITFYSKYLHQHTKETLVLSIKELLGCLFDNVNHIDIQVSRVDLHTDVTNGTNMLSYDEVSSSISRSKVRNHYFENDELILTERELEFLKPPCDNNKGGQKLILPVGIVEKLMKMYDNQVNVGVSQVIKKKELETAYFGKQGSDIWGKCYNKTKQVLTKNDDDTPLLWEENGWNGTDVIVRTEFSMRRSFLKQLDNGKYVSLDGLLNNVDKIWVYLTEKWLRLVEEVKENNTTWSKITNFWFVVQQSFKEVSNTIIRKKKYDGKVNQLWKQGIGCISQMIAIGMNTNDDVMFLKSTITAIKNTLSQQEFDGEYYNRRQHLGIA